MSATPFPKIEILKTIPEGCLWLVPEKRDPSSLQTDEDLFRSMVFVVGLIPEHGANRGHGGQS